MLLTVLLIVYALTMIAQSADRINTVKSPFFLQSFLTTTVLIVYLAVHSQVAAAVNKELDSHRFVFTSNYSMYILCYICNIFIISKNGQYWFGLLV
jgi:hypothetical protein